MSKRALYRHYDDNDGLLYVGITSDLKNRFKAHERRSEWWVFTVRHTVEWFDDWKDAAAAEISAIRAESPEFNVVHNLPSRPVKEIVLIRGGVSSMPDENQCFIDSEHFVELASDRDLRGLPLSVYLFMISRIEKDKVCRVPQVLIADEFDASAQYLSKVMKTLKDKNLVTELKELGALKTYRLTSELIIVHEDGAPTKVATRAIKLRAPEYVDFDRFWSVWPKKVDGKEARKVWNKLKPSEELYNKIINHCTRAFTDTEKRFIPGPAKYLRGEKWNDEVITEAPKLGFDSDTPSWKRRDEHGLFSNSIIEGELN